MGTTKNSPGCGCCGDVACPECISGNTYSAYGTFSFENSHFGTGLITTPELTLVETGRSITSGGTVCAISLTNSDYATANAYNTPSCYETYCDFDGNRRYQLWRGLLRIGITLTWRTTGFYVNISGSSKWLSKLCWVSGASPACAGSQSSFCPTDSELAATSTPAEFYGWWVGSGVAPADILIESGATCGTFPFTISGDTLSENGTGFPYEIESDGCTGDFTKHTLNYSIRFEVS